MAHAQSMLRAQAGAATNENPKAVAARAGGRLGAGEPGASPQLQLLPPWRLLNPSQQVYNTWAEGSVTRGGHPCPPKSTPRSVLPVEQTLRSKGAQGTDRQDIPASRPPRPDGEGPRHRQPVLVLFSLCALHTHHPARICLNLQEHGRRQALPHSGTAVTGFAPGQGGASQSPFRFLFLPMPLLEAWHRLPRGDMKEEGTQ